VLQWPIFATTTSFTALAGAYRGHAEIQADLVGSFTEGFITVQLSMKNVLRPRRDDFHGITAA
jgi:hypothetical protein